LRWIPLSRQVVQKSLRLRWKDVFEIYTYPPTIPLAEALALEARRAGSDTHITLMTDDLWFTSMEELPARWLRTPSPAEYALNSAITADIYLGGPRDARRFKSIPTEKFAANEVGGTRQREPRYQRKVRHVDLPVGRVCPERAEAYGLDYEKWEKNYYSALEVDLREIQRAASKWIKKLRGHRKMQIHSEAGTDLRITAKPIPPLVDDGIVGPSDIRRGFSETTLPAGKILWSVNQSSAEGEVHSTDPVIILGRAVRGLHLSFRGGRVTDWESDSHSELLDKVFANANWETNLGWISLGLNAAAEPVLLDNSIVQNDVGIGLGPHFELEKSKPSTKIQLYATIGPAIVEASQDPFVSC
jgi:leucyl aminopeptidase (aminopeptidase T)